MKHLGDVVTDVKHRLLFTEDPDPAVLQAVFAVLFVLDLTLRGWGQGHLGLRSWPSLGLAVAVTACVAGAIVPWQALPRWAVGTLALADLLAIGLSRLEPNASGAGILAAVPAIWLGARFGLRGALCAAAAVVGLIALPGLVYFGASEVNLSRVVLLPVVAFWCALSIAAALEGVRAGRDAAERRRVDLAAALGALEHQRQASQAIFDTVDVGLLLLDDQGNYQGMNRRHHEFMRLAFPEGHAGRAGQLGDVYRADGSAVDSSEEAPSYRASRGEEFQDHRIWVGRDPLSRRALSVSARRVETGDGEFRGAALAYQDVTDFIRALEVRDEFVASVSHELRTPLTSIAGYVDILRERDDLPGDVTAQLEVVARNADRLGRLVGDLLHTARLDDGGVPLARRETDLVRIVRQGVEAAMPPAAAAGVDLRLEGPRSLVLLVDPERMAQVVDNLVSNAIKYTPAGGAVVVSLGIDAGRAELCVTDTGIGISAADRDRLFTRFFRSHEVVRQAMPGVGLGLSITKAIVEGHGGRIEVDSEPGVGSRFRVRIPLTGN